MEWETPPPNQRTKCVHEPLNDFVNELKRHPGEWGVYTRSQRGGHVSRYKLLYPGTEWAARASGKLDGVYTIYGRFVGVNNMGTGEEP
jgi:hypothetical protein